MCVRKIKPSLQPPDNAMFNLKLGPETDLSVSLIIISEKESTSWRDGSAQGAQAGIPVPPGTEFNTSSDPFLSFFFTVVSELWETFFLVEQC